ncbi:tyrosine-protein phosphatase [Lactobacillus sp. DCY120]|uniref:Tyrosine-protein phosphatase n=1 Tax=Bombilactobacillus apium TaxID=2675299 RepID=A0A850R045_9LACO|nr:tyrosine-protein phosphatase [Bombilactobacillus apium]NVY96419.1 tyrosine-protein phosphatase [Bombilactobacillus apium]
MESKQTLKLEAGINFRELGGYQTQTGQKIKSHKLVRSASLGHLSPADLDFLNNYQIAYDIDFRSSEESQQVPDRVPDSAEYVFNPVFREDLTQASKFADDQPEEQPEHDIEGMSKVPLNGHRQMIQTYRELITNSSAQKAYRTFFDKLLANDQEGHALLFHCTAGKDRTGMGAIFILTALGVDRETIVQDYLLTNTTSKPFINETLQKLSTVNNVSDQMYDSVKSLLTVHEEYLQAADEEVQKMSGSWFNYLQKVLKVDDAQIAQLRSIYLEAK